MRRWANAAAAWVLLALAPAAIGLHAQSRPDAPESSVKAAFLFKFAGYVEWPPSLFAAPDAPFVIAVTGADDIAAELAVIVAGRNVAGHPVVVKRVREGEPLKDVHVLFAGRATPRLANLLKAAQQQGVLSVTEAERGLEMGSAINFVVADNRVGFEVSLDSADKSGHKISSRMLAVARRVVPKT